MFLGGRVINKPLSSPSPVHSAPPVLSCLIRLGCQRHNYFGGLSSFQTILFVNLYHFIFSCWVRNQKRVLYILKLYFSLVSLVATSFKTATLFRWQVWRAIILIGRFAQGSPSIRSAVSTLSPPGFASKFLCAVVSRLSCSVSFLLRHFNTS